MPLSHSRDVYICHWLPCPDLGHLCKQGDFHATHLQMFLLCWEAEESPAEDFCVCLQVQCVVWGRGRGEDNLNMGPTPCLQACVGNSQCKEFSPACPGCAVRGPTNPPSALSDIHWEISAGIYICKQGTPTPPLQLTLKP